MFETTKCWPLRYRSIRRALLTVVIMAAYSVAHHADAQQLPNLTGAWACPRDEGVLRGERLTWNLTFDIDWQEGRFFMGTYRWSVDEEHGVKEFSDGELTLSNEVHFQGVIDWDNKRFVMVDVGDTGVVTGSLANDDTLQLIGYEAGDHPLVAAAICVRLPNSQ